MKRLTLIAIVLMLIINASAQNQIRLKAGFQGTYTAIAEYRQPGKGIYLDTVELNKQVYGALAMLEIDMDLGKNFLMVTGFGYDRKGLADITYTDVFGRSQSKEARQNYMGIHLQIKYHYRFKDSKIGLFLASGPKVDFAIGGSNYAEYSLAPGYDYYHTFGSFNVVEFLWYTNLGISYKIGPGEIIFDAHMLNGLSDAIRNRYVVGKTTSFGASIGYSFYLD